MTTWNLDKLMRDNPDLAAANAEVVPYDWSHSLHPHSGVSVASVPVLPLEMDEMAVPPSMATAVGQRFSSKTERLAATWLVEQGVYGWIAYEGMKFSIPSGVYTPDFVALKDGELHFFEVKHETGMKNQQQWAASRIRFLTAAAFWGVGGRGVGHFHMLIGNAQNLFSFRLLLPSEIARGEK